MLAAVAVPVATADGTTTSGRITSLTTKRIAIDGTQAASCRIDAESPKIVRRFIVGNRVVISCKNGVLTGIRGLDAAPVATAKAAGPASIVSSATAHPSPTGVVTDTSLVGRNVPITALTATAITVGAGSISVTCAIGATSPDVGGFRAGERAARVECKNGTLTKITRSP